MSGKTQKRLLIFACSLAISICVALAATSLSYAAQTIVDEWNTVKVPPAPELKTITIDPKVTALLILDIQKQICTPERTRCQTSLPIIQGLLTRARAKGVPIIYSLGRGTAADIYPEVAPQAGDPLVTSGPDKFWGTELEKILKEKGITTVIVVGTAAHGAVLYTASGAALRGLKVIVPVDGMSADEAYTEQYTAWHLLNAPRVGAQVSLTRIDMIQYP